MAYTWITPVTDRVEYDDYFYSINRVENNTGYISDVLISYRYAAEITVKNDWTQSDTFNEDANDSERVIDNINLMVQLLADSGIEIPDDLDLLTFENANNIERTLEWLKTVVDNLDNILKRLEFRLGGDTLGT